MTMSLRVRFVLDEGRSEKNRCMRSASHMAEVGPQVVDTHSGGFERCSSEVPADAALFGIVCSSRQPVLCGTDLILRHPMR